ncbi:MAG TPA: zinc ribbon domain-containing protein [Anaerolineales bacterium]|nr:zinc ribbon domain-containing protein [Anaerolineales bacterium]
MSDFFGKLKSGAEKVAFEAEKMNRLNRAKGELEKLKNQIQVQYSKLGEMYYTQHETMGVTGPAYDEMCQAIKGLEQQALVKNEEIQRINAEVFTPQGAQPAAQPIPAPVQSSTAPAQTESTPQAAPAAAETKFCPNCGREMPVATKFCPDCGTKVG